MAISEEQGNIIISKLDTFEKRLFHDNGGECMQSKINRHDQIVATQEKRWKWVIGISSTLFLMVFGRIIYDIIW